MTPFSCDLGFEGNRIDPMVSVKQLLINCLISNHLFKLEDLKAIRLKYNKVMGNILYLSGRPLNQ